MNKQTLAQRAAEIMQREDQVSRWLGMRLQEVRPGHVRMSMRVTDNMVNGQKICHGGLIFTLADTSFGFACNTHNQRAVAASCSIDFLAPAHEVARAGRSAVYDVRVTNQRAELIALFRGKSATVKGNWIE